MAKDKKNKKKSRRMSRQAFDRELTKLQVELCKLQSKVFRTRYRSCIPSS